MISGQDETPFPLESGLLPVGDEQTFAEVILTDFDCDLAFNGLVIINTFDGEELTQVADVLGVDPEDVERFQKREVRGLVAGIVGAAFERVVPALEPDPAPEELDDLGALALPDVDEPHAGDPVAVPAFDELLRTDEHVHSGVRGVDGAEEGGMIDLLDIDLRLVLFDDLYELRCVPDVDIPKEVVVAAFEADLPVGVLQEHEGETGGFGATEDAAEHVAVDILRAQSTLPEVTQALLGVGRAEEVVFGLFVEKAGFPLEEFIRGPDHPIPLSEDFLQEPDDREHVGLGAGDVDLAPHEYPERVGDVVLGGGDVFEVLEDQFLLVVGEEVCEEHPVRFVRGFVDVEDAVLLAVAVVVEVRVGVVDEDGLGKFGEVVVIASRSRRLPEGGAVLEGEALTGNFTPEHLPLLAAAALVGFVHEDEVLPAETLDVHPLEAAVLLVLGEPRDLDDVHGLLGLPLEVAAETGGVELGAGNAALLHLPEVLGGEVTIRGDEENAVDIQPMGSFVVVLELEVGEVDEEGLARTGRHPVGALAEVVHAGHVPLVIVIGVQNGRKSLFDESLHRILDQRGESPGALEVTVQVGLGEEGGEPLVVLEVDGNVTMGVDAVHVPHDVVVVVPQLVERDAGVCPEPGVALEDVVVVGVPVLTLALLDAGESPLEVLEGLHPKEAVRKGALDQPRPEFPLLRGFSRCLPFLSSPLCRHALTLPCAS